MLAAAHLVAFGVEAHAATIARWSFDTASLTTAGGNITGAADATGNHNAVPGMGIGSATAAQGGPTFISNAIPVANSVPGKFGQALTLSGSNNAAGGGGQFLMFPNLTELMASSGAPSYTVSYWIQTTTTNAHQFTVLADWGNAATNPGRFTYGYGFNIATGVAQMRGQSRFNISGTGNGTDIFARAVNTAALNDGNWHMLTWTFNSGSGQLSSYFDGNLVDTFQSSAANFAMVASSSPFGSIGLKGDSGNFINGSYTLDEVWVFNHGLGPLSVRNLFTNNLGIPEPASLLLCMCGVIAAYSIQRRKR
jgi:hypothetical protein